MSVRQGLILKADVSELTKAVADDSDRRKLGRVLFKSVSTGVVRLS